MDSSSKPTESKKSRSRAKDGSSSKKRGSHEDPKSHGSRTTLDTATSTSRAESMASTQARVERRPSTTARPTSEMTSAAELNAIRAREVWEMDRLWKGRSMAYGLEGPQVIYAQSIGAGSSSSVNGDVRRASTLSPGAYGSSHTSYKVQSGFDGAQPHTQIPFPPPPSLYPNSPQPQLGPPYIYPSGYRSYPDISTLPTISSPESSPPRRSLTNPLPEPPRQSIYKPPPLPASLANPDAASTADFWSKYAGIATATH